MNKSTRCHKKLGRLLLLVTVGSLAMLWICSITLDFHITSFLYHSSDSEENILAEWFDSPNSSYDDDVLCKVPRLNPYDPSIASLIDHPGPASCKRSKPYLTYIDDNGYLTINTTETVKRKFYCVYSTFDRKEGPDEDARHYDPEIVFVNETKLNSNMVDVKCKYSKNNKTFYHNIHAHPSPQLNSTYLPLPPSEEQLNVLFFHIDSVSHSAFKRNLRKTRKYTRDVMGMKYFNAFNKVGLNSFPNLMVTLTGLRMYDEQSDLPNEVPPKLFINDSMKFDDWPFVWKQFEKKGYSTVFIEDNEHIGLFNYNAQGFNRKPFHYHYNPFYRAFDATCSGSRCWYCFGNWPITQITTDLIARHIIALKDRRLFIYGSTTEFSHGTDNEVEKIDEIMVGFWRRLHENDLLNRTAVFFVSDHGIRFGKIRESLVGFLEEQLPFYGIWFPIWFYKKYPHIERNLNRNSEILSSTFDTYETFLDILNINFGGEQRNISNRGQSQLYPLPKNRSCNQAGIPDQYCSCVDEEHLDNDDPLVVQGAYFVVSTLNEILSGVADICQKIDLHRISYANRVGFTKAKTLNEGTKSSLNETLKKLKSKLGLSQNIKIQFESLPFKAMFQALVKITNFYDETKREFSVIGDIIRVSKYAGLSDCINDRRLRMYCPCKNLANISSFAKEILR